MPHRLVRLALAAAIAIAATLPARAAFETRASAAYVLDVTTGTVLLEKEADVPLPPASMSKLMTLNILFEALRDGRVSMDTQFSVSARAQAMGGSTMFLNEQDRPTVNELIHGIIVNSGNDACVVVAEGLAGSEEAFARLMTERARALGMENTTLANASGWPHPDHRMSVRDLGILTERLITEFPDLYTLFNEREYDYKDRAPANRFNRNPLFRVFPDDPARPEDIRADGLKTGHTQEAGYGLAGSVTWGERRVIFVITGLETEQARIEESERIVNWAFRQFSPRTVAEAGARVAQADVWLGAAPRVGLVPAADVEILVPAMVQDGVQAEVRYHGPIEAPISAGQVLADLVISIPDMAERRVPLVAENDIGAGGFGTRVGTAARILLNRALGQVAF